MELFAWEEALKDAIVVPDDEFKFILLAALGVFVHETTSDASPTSPIVYALYLQAALVHGCVVKNVVVNWNDIGTFTEYHKKCSTVQPTDFFGTVTTLRGFIASSKSVQGKQLIETFLRKFFSHYYKDNNVKTDTIDFLLSCAGNVEKVLALSLYFMRALVRNPTTVLANFKIEGRGSEVARFCGCTEVFSSFPVDPKYFGSWKEATNELLPTAAFTCAALACISPESYNTVRRLFGLRFEFSSMAIINNDRLYNCKAIIAERDQQIANLISEHDQQLRDLRDEMVANERSLHELIVTNEELENELATLRPQAAQDVYNIVNCAYNMITNPVIVQNSQIGKTGLTVLTPIIYVESV
ncbi:unnamed protein product [Bursaphelenchus okinawaensis]|uniref:Uncharacterized protein n=1 Tax=Bursaphelenchus okinawaensis TaxID=465554 RepID=A0A811JR86_9BILA|nr:unnamed protein product [Bursaphelenchus okinawaensis]CAG9078589.1 unnamed protein product [Bursaphelenchus okinawaensis]